VAKIDSRFVYYEVSIEISPAPDLYVVEFEFPRPHLGISVILPATCGLAAKLRAWTLYPEYKRDALSVSAYRVEFAEIDWQTGRCIVMKEKKRPTIPFLQIEDFNLPGTRKKQDEEGAQ
jgi:hypothetical protein